MNISMNTSMRMNMSILQDTPMSTTVTHLVIRQLTIQEEVKRKSTIKSNQKI